MTRIAAIALALTVAVTACSSDSSTSAGATIVGSYSLSKIGGKGMPVVQTLGATQVTTSTGTFELTSAGSYTLTIPQQYNTNGTVTTVTITQTGTFQRNESSILFQPSDRSPGTTGTLENGTIEVSIANVGLCDFTK